jgi:Protein of unknown function (DUF2934)
MKPRVVPGSRPKVRAGSATPDVGPQGAGLCKIGPLEDAHARIAALAYQLYEQRGREEGHDVEDWLDAERKILIGKS